MGTWVGAEQERQASRQMDGGGGEGLPTLASRPMQGGRRRRRGSGQ